MGQISSINFKKTNKIQTKHNDRALPPDYLIGRDFQVNRNHSEALESKKQIITKAQKDYRRLVGQKFKATAYEWSAVCNIKENSTMADLERLAKHFSDKYGFQCYQIAIHRDEGWIDEETGEKHINHHAHLEFVTLDKETGKSRKRGFTRKVMREIQDEVAEILQMERGIDKRISRVKRIEPRIYAKMKEDTKRELRAERARNREVKAELSQEEQDKDYAIDFLKRENKKLQAEILTQTAIKAEFEKVRKLMIEWGFCNKDDYKIRTESLKAFIETHKTKQYTQEDLYKAIQDLKDKIQENHRNEISSRDEIITQKNSHISTLEAKMSHLEKENDGLRKSNLLKGEKVNITENKDEIIQSLKNENKSLKRENRLFRQFLKLGLKYIEKFDSFKIEKFDSFKMAVTLIKNFLNKPNTENLRATKTLNKTRKQTPKMRQSQSHDFNRGL